MKTVVTIVLFFWFSGVCSEELKFGFLEGEITFTYDENILSREDLESYLIVHPLGYSPDYHIGPSLRLCIEGGDQYFECGSRDLEAPNFFKNAKVNINIGKTRIETLSKLTKFPELEGLVEYFKSSLEFDVWRNERLFDYYTTWNIEALERTFKGIEPSMEKLAVLEKLSMAKDKNVKWKLSFYDWATAVNHEYRDLENEIPTSGWEQFKSKYQLTEKIEYDEAH